MGQEAYMTTGLEMTLITLIGVAMCALKKMEVSQDQKGIPGRYDPGIA